MPTPLELSALTALSPLDGRYGASTAALRDVFSEFAFMRARVRIEVEWLLALSRLGLPELPPLAPEAADRLRALASGFTVADCAEIKDTERVTNHDVKAVEYWIRGRTADLPALAAAAEFIHFACTSEDINNVAHALMLADGRALLLERLRAIHAALRAMAHEHAEVAMLSRTHGQPASPTTVGKEFANFAVRLARAIADVDAALGVVLTGAPAAGEATPIVAGFDRRGERPGQGCRPRGRETPGRWNTRSEPGRPIVTCPRGLLSSHHRSVLSSRRAGRMPRSDSMDSGKQCE